MDILKPHEVETAYRKLSTADLMALGVRARAHLQELNPSPRGPQPVDPLPWVVSVADWELFRRAADQWGRLLSAVYGDLFGPQNLIAQGILDAPLVWETLGFSPSLSRALPAGCPPLGLVRLEAARTKAGPWRLRSVGTGVPRGLGFAIETRIVHSRFFGSQVPHQNLVRLAPFLQGLKDQWSAQSLTHKDEPAIMVWTEGPSDPAYHEPVYLSRYFGYPLVESRDLTVRSGKVYLNTLGGLRPVDVLIRMVGDGGLDPLEGGRGTGVAGLVQAVRDGTVLVTNAPGAGILEHPQFLSRYDRLARELLGEPLVLPPGGPEGLPETSDFFSEGTWTPSPTLVHLFAARFSSGWELMPGGLVVREDQGQLGPFAVTRKDLWVLATGVVAPTTLLPSGEKPVEIHREADLPSRVADDLFWLGRYTERAWMDLRFLEKWWELHDEGGSDAHQQGVALVDRLVEGLGILPGPGNRSDPVWRSSRLATTLGSIDRVAGQVLDRLSMETHRILRELSQPLESGGLSLPEVLRQVNLRLTAFAGLTMESMTRNPGWRFLDMGRRLERAHQVVDTLEHFFALDPADERLVFLLDLFDSGVTYRSRYRLSPQRAPVLDLLLLDETNPRALAFQLEQLSAHVDALPRGAQSPHRTIEGRTILSVLTRVRMEEGAALGTGALPGFLRDLGTRLETFSDALNQTYLAKIDPMESIQARGPGEP